jgi:membrane protein YqaA with SNARE-associated domain
MEWIERYLKVKPEKIEKTQKFLQGRGAYMAFFAFLPILGTLIAITLGYMRSNRWIVLASMTAGKLIRYIIILLLC